MLWVGTRSSWRATALFALRAVEDPRLERALEHAQLVLELVRFEALSLGVSPHIAEREPEAEVHQGLHRESLEAGGAEIGDEGAGLIQKPGPIAVTSLKRVQELRHSAAADGRPTLRTDRAHA